MSCEKIRYERIEFTDENKVSCSVSDQDEEVEENTLECVRKYHVTSLKEKVKLTQKYSIVKAVDPVTGLSYDLSAIIKGRMIDMATTDFRVPSTGQLVPLDEAIDRGMVVAELFDEQVEKTNECYEYIEENRTPYSSDPLTKELGGGGGGGLWDDLLFKPDSGQLRQIKCPGAADDSDEDDDDDEVKTCLDRLKLAQLGGDLFITEV